MFPPFGTSLSAKLSTHNHIYAQAILVRSDYLTPTHDSGYSLTNPAKVLLSYSYIFVSTVCFFFHKLPFSIIIISGKLMKMILNKIIVSIVSISVPGTCK